MSVAERIVEDPKTGLFGFRIELARRPDGSRRQARRGGFASARAAQVAFDKMRRDLNSATPRARLRGDLPALCEGWLQSRGQEIEPNTVHNYRYMLDLVCEQFKKMHGQRRVSQFSGKIADEIYAELEAQGHSRTMLRKLHLILTKAFGEETGLTLGAHRPRPSDWVKSVWVIEEARAFLVGVADDRLYLLWRLIILTGLRRAEACGLKWRDIDFVTGMLKVYRQRPVDSKTGKVTEKRLKSENGKRTVALDAETLRLLTQANASTRSKYMFLSRSGDVLRADNLTDRFNQLARKLGIRPLGPHQARHLLGTSMLDIGYGIHEVAERLGHDPATLLRFYTRVGADRRIQASEDAAALMTGTGSVVRTRRVSLTLRSVAARGTAAGARPNPNGR